MRSKSAPHLGSARKNSGMSSFTSAGPVVALSHASRMLQKSRSGASKRPPCRLQAPSRVSPEARRARGRRQPACTHHSLRRAAWHASLACAVHHVQPRACVQQQRAPGTETRTAGGAQARRGPSRT